MQFQKKLRYKQPKCLSKYIKEAKVEFKPRLSFYGFFKQSWNIIDKTAAYIDNWHIRVLCNELESKADDRRKEIGSETVVTVPPSSTKSRIVSIAFHPWVWTFWPEACFITSTYEATLAGDFSRKSRELILSEWYQSQWPLVLTKELESMVENSRGGSRTSCGVAGAITGKHAHFQLMDDLIKEQKARLGSPKMIASAMNTANGFAFGTLATREVSEATCKVMVGQRLGKKDPPGEAERRGFRRINFPALLNKAKRDPLDERTEEGEVLCEKRRSKEGWSKLRLVLGVTAAKSQIDQDPMDSSGGKIKKEYFNRRWSVLPARIQQALETGVPLDGQRFIDSWDFSFKGEERNDWTVGQLWCKDLGLLYLIDEVRDKVSFLAAQQMVLGFHSRYPVSKEHVFEDAANAPAIYDSMKEVVPGLKLQPHGGGTFARTQASEGIWASGNIVTPMLATWMNGEGGFIEEHITYTGQEGETDDRVSASSQAVLYLTSEGIDQSFLDAMDAFGKERLGFF